MVEFDTNKNLLRICIPVTDLKDLDRHHKSIMKILEQIEIDENTPSLIEALDCVYGMLLHMQPDQALTDRYNALQKNE